MTNKFTKVIFAGDVDDLQSEDAYQKEYLTNPVEEATTRKGVEVSQPDTVDKFKVKRDR